MGALKLETSKPYDALTYILMSRFNKPEEVSPYIQQFKKLLIEKKGNLSEIHSYMRAVSDEFPTHYPVSLIGDYDNDDFGLIYKKIISKNGINPVEYSDYGKLFYLFGKQVLKSVAISSNEYLQSYLSDILKIPKGVIFDTIFKNEDSHDKGGSLGLTQIMEDQIHNLWNDLLEDFAQTEDEDIDRKLSTFMIPISGRLKNLNERPIVDTIISMLVGSFYSILGFILSEMDDQELQEFFNYGKNSEHRGEKLIQYLKDDIKIAPGKLARVLRLVAVYAEIEKAVCNITGYEFNDRFSDTIRNMGEAITRGYMEVEDRKKIITNNPVKILTEFNNHEDLGVMMAIKVFSKTNAVDKKLIEKALSPRINKESEFMDTGFVSFRVGLMDLLTGKKNYSSPYNKILKGVINGSTPLFSETMSGSLKALWNKMERNSNWLSNNLDPVVYENLIRISAVVRIYLDPRYKYYGQMTTVDKVVAKLMIMHLDFISMALKDRWNDLQPLELNLCDAFQYDRDKKKLYPTEKLPYSQIKKDLLTEIGGITIRYAEFVETLYWKGKEGSDSSSLQAYKSISKEPIGFGQLYHETIESAYSLYAANKLPLVYTIGEYTDLVKDVPITSESRRIIKLLKTMLVKPSVEDNLDQESTLFKLDTDPNMKPENVQPLIGENLSISYLQAEENTQAVESAEKLLNDLDLSTYILCVFKR